MKSIYLPAIILLSALTSCSLMETPEAYADKSDIFASEQGLEAYSLSFYKHLPTLSSIPVCEASGVDYAACRSFSTYYSNNSYTAETPTSWSWGNLRSINYFIDGLHSSECTVSDDIRNHYEGLARWFRAYFYYGKLTEYGAVPWYDHCLSNIDTEQMYKNRDSRDVIIGHIIEDLDYAYENIMTESSISNTLISKYAAPALKSRACLFEASWRKYHGEAGKEWNSKQLYNECIEASNILMNGKFSLNKTTIADEYIDSNSRGAYRSLFYSREVLTNEVILGVAASLEYGVTGDANWRFNSGSYGNSYCLSRAFVHTYLHKNGRPFTNSPANLIKSFKDEFTNRDERLKQTVRGPKYRMDNKYKVLPDIINGVAPTGYHPIKFVEDMYSKNDKAKNENSYPLIRYAEILLNYAEARAEIGELTESDWQQTIGELRKRAGIDSSSDAVTKLPSDIDVYLQETFYPRVTDPVILEIRRERAIELVYEGFRVNDLNRWAEGKRFETVPWTGIHINAVEAPVDINGDGTNDHYFSEKELSEIPTLYKSMYVKIYPVESLEQGLRAVPNPAGGYDLRYELALKRKWYDDGRQYLQPIPAQIVRDYANRGYVIDQNPGW